MALELEMETYKKKLPELRGLEGKFALIKGDKLVDVFGSYEDALRQGYRDFALEPFLVKQIQLTEKVQTITRLLVPAITA